MSQQHEQYNQLSETSSPYLLQHADNPVAWQPWGEDALRKAKEENKLIIISIGYSACHWCHVMEKESFSDPEVAKVMNENFINIKVDREERPDVDQVYMEALQLMTGQGGWPLNIIALPDQRPVFGGTYFPRDNWIELLNKVAYLYKTEPARFEEYARKMLKALQSLDKPQELDARSQTSGEQLQQIYKSLTESFDDREGGMKGAPKFPMPVIWNSLLYYYLLSGNKEMADYSMLTLDHMAAGGIYDQIGGGFARYSTDEDWVVPHFEKMLYDNAQLLELYANAYRLTGKERYKEVIMETASFLFREMSADEGAFYSALDADSEGEEGRYYVWNPEEFRKVCGDEAEWAEKFFGFGGKGRWEDDKYILLQARDKEELRSEYGFSAKELETRLRSLKKKLFEARSFRVRPNTDDKVLTSWNAMAVTGLVAAYKALNEEHLLNAALANAEFIRSNMCIDGRLFHNYHKGTVSVPGFLEDYAHWIRALCDLYEVTYEENYLKEAAGWVSTVFELFAAHKPGPLYFTAEDDSNLIARKKEIPDNVVPSSNSVMAYNLYRLAHWYDREDWSDYAVEMIRLMKPQIMRTPAFHAMWLQVMAMYSGPFFSLAVAGEGAADKAKALENKFLPIKVLAVSEGAMETAIPFLKDKAQTGKGARFFLCEGKTCDAPAEDENTLLEQLRQKLKRWQDEHLA